MMMTKESMRALRSELERLGKRNIRLDAWDRYILGETDKLISEVLPARDAAHKEMERWKGGRFPGLPLAVADAIFSKQKDYGTAVRNSTRPFASAFARMPLRDFCALDSETIFRLTFGKPTRSGKERSHLAPEGRVRSIRQAAQVFLSDGIETPDQARAAFASPPAIGPLERKLTGVFGLGGDMLANIRMNIGVLTVKPDLHVRAFLAAFLDLPQNAPSSRFEECLSEAREVLGMEPFEVDQVIWYTQSASGRV